MTKAFAQRSAVLFSLVLLAQVIMPWHAMHMAALADSAASDDAQQTAPLVAGSPCHPPMAANGGNDESEPPIVGFCEWLCAQAQCTPAFDGLMQLVAAPAGPPSGLLTNFDSLVSPVPTPPPIV